MSRNRERESAGTGRGHRDTALAGPGPLARERDPSTRSRLVRREALFERLSAAPADCLALVCAPAGSGKTILVRSWLEADELLEQTAWVAVEPRERDAQHFWTSVIDALAGAIDGSVERLGPTPEFRGEAVVERLLGDLRSVEEPLVLVIDDLHELQSPDALEWLELFITGRPANLRIVLTSRAEPELNLHRLRLGGALTEIRGSDLRFSREEVGELLQASEIELSDEAVALLHERTEGWVAGLRLAAISLGGHPDPERFVRDFSGSDRSVAGYLMAEVLGRQPPEVCELLLRTSILDRVTGGLADAMTGRSGSERLLLDLEVANAFVTSLDADRTWFRYHHLFADFLRLDLRRTEPASIDSLHRTAARWYEEHGHPAEAIRHAQATSDWRYAARVLADSYISLILDGRLGTVAGLLATFPPEAAAEDAELAIVLAGARLFEGRADETDAYIEVADRVAETVPEERRRRFDLRVASTKLWLARRRVDLPAALEAMRGVEAALAAQSASDIARAADHRAAAMMNIGIAELWSVRPGEARRHLDEGLALAQQAERPYLEIGCLAHLGIAAPAGGGSILDGVHYAEQAIASAEALGWGEDAIITPALAIGGVGVMWIGQFDEAEGRLERADRALRPEVDPMTTLVVHWATGLLRLIQGRFEEALAGFTEAQRLKSLMSEEVRTIEPRGVMLQTQVRMGEAAAASAALAELDEDERDRALVRIAAAEIHLAQDDPEAALDVLAPVIEGSARAAHSTTSLIDALLFEALARDRLGDARVSEEAIERALDLAEPEGIVVPFAVAPVAELLERHPRHRTAHVTLLSEILDVLAGSSATARGTAAPLRDELSDAELRVVRFLPSNLKAPEIAAELFVSPNTVRTHLRHIYSKLDAHSRAEAVERARELGLLAPSRLG
jgi:LuxR family maltose regulon positive regulatory protein